MGLRELGVVIIELEKGESELLVPCLTKIWQKFFDCFFVAERKT